MPDKAKLPTGKTCNNCVNFSRCYFLCGVFATDTRCDFDPSRFYELQTCPDCEGSGEVAGDYFSDDGMTICGRCNGKGHI